MNCVFVVIIATLGSEGGRQMMWQQLCNSSITFQGKQPWNDALNWTLIEVYWLFTGGPVIRGNWGNVQLGFQPYTHTNVIVVGKFRWWWASTVHTTSDRGRIGVKVAHSSQQLTIFVGFPVSFDSKWQESCCWEEWDVVALRFLSKKSAVVFRSSQSRDFCYFAFQTDQRLIKTANGW